MLLVLTAIDEDYQLREFSCYLQKLEVGFDLLNDIVAKGHTLVKAHLVDDDHSTVLPLDAFDGTSFLVAIQELEQEWQSLLQEPQTVPAPDHTELTHWTELRVQLYEKRITNLNWTLGRLKQIQQRDQDRTSFKPTQSGLEVHYSSLINRYEVQLIKAHLIHNVMLERLSLLRASD